MCHESAGNLSFVFCRLAGFEQGRGLTVFLRRASLPSGLWFAGVFQIAGEAGKHRSEIGQRTFDEGQHQT